MYLETLESLCLFYDCADPTTRDQTTEMECWKCCISRDPILRHGHQWLIRCLVGFLPTSFTLSKDLYESHRDVWDYLTTVFGKNMQVLEGEVDVGSLDSNILPGGFLLTEDTLDDPEWIHMVTAGLHLWRRRYILPSLA